MQKKIHTECIACNSTKLNKLEGYDAPVLLKCKTCKLVFCEAIPTERELNQYYQNYGYTQFLSPVTVKRYHQWLDEMELYRKTNNLLDVGCGNGFFLETAKERGWNVYGTEYSAQLVEVCERKGIRMEQGPLKRETFETIEFDVISSIEVIEHTNNHSEETKTISSKLRPGGLFFVTTPNWNALSRFWLKSNYNIISYPEHLTYFTPGTLTSLMHMHGLKKKKVDTTGISLTRFNQSTGRKAQQVVSATSDDELLRVKIEKNLSLRIAKWILNAVLNALGIGYSLKGWYVKQ